MRLALFASYDERDIICNYIKFYLENLNKHFDEVLFITNKRKINHENIKFLKMINVNLLMVENEGYDFGMWYKGMLESDMNSVSLLGLYNDSCILFNDLNSIMGNIEKSDFNALGITDSKEFHHHLQSYFLVFKDNVISEVYEYFLENGIQNSEDVRNIIEIYEIGLSKHLIKNGNCIKAFYSQSAYKKRNISLLCADKLIKSGCPLIKKKLITKKFREHEVLWLDNECFDFSKNYVNIIKEQIKKKISVFSIF